MIKTNNARLQSRPFIIYPDSDISGTAGGNPNRENYCDLDTTSGSRYHLNRDDHNNIFQFFGNILTATNKPVYCLDKFADGPYNDVPYESRPFETIFPATTNRQKNMFGWIMANTYPAVSADATFALAGVDPAADPALDDNDAYAAVQVALWVLLGQISLDEVYFLDCGTGEPHPKSDRLRTAVLNLLRLAGEYADGATDTSRPSPSSGTGRCANAGINCCNKRTMPPDPGAPYFIFQGCPDEVRTVCGRMLIGPFKILSNFTGQPQITVTPFCSCGDDYSVTFMDFCGNPIADPAIGQEFYIAVRACQKQICLTVTASYTGTITRVISMEAQSTALNYQPIGTSFDDEPVTLTAELCLCVNSKKHGKKNGTSSKS
ncbi:MAG: thioester domain-containing protein, partial [Clostridiales bacterium]|nr:thioester domain-containing protein [Clostridiales bacterium]